MYKVTKENLHGFLGGKFPGNETWETVTCRNTTGWNYDQRQVSNKQEWYTTVSR
jgi:hypothetical protein